MAKQKGIIKLGGTIGDITFYKSKDGYIAREKGGLDANRIATDPNFKRTRENGSEFGRAGRSGKVLRTAFRNLLQNASDSRMVSRLTKHMIEVIQADGTSVRGLRNVPDGKVELLQDFEFNIAGKLSTSLYASYTTKIDRAAGTLTIDMPSFVPANTIAAPGGTTHYKIVSGGAEVDFENKTFITDSNNGDLTPWDATATRAISLINKVTPNSAHPLFLVLGIEFSQVVNGVQYPLMNGAYNPLALVKVTGA